MCNLYSITKSQRAIRDLVKAMVDKTGNMPPLHGIFPDYGAPIVREGDKGRELVLARWGMPSPLFALRGKKTDPGSPIYATPCPPTGGVGLEPNTAVSSRSPAFPRTN